MELELHDRVFKNSTHFAKQSWAFLQPEQKTGSNFALTVSMATWNWETTSGNTKFGSTKAKVDAQPAVVEARDGFLLYDVIDFHMS